MEQLMIFLGNILEIFVWLLGLIWLVATKLFLSDIIVACIVWLLILIAMFYGFVFPKRNAYKIVSLVLTIFGLVTIFIHIIIGG